MVGSFGNASTLSGTANPDLSVIEIEALLREKVRNRADTLQQVQVYLALTMKCCLFDMKWHFT